MEDTESAILLSSTILDEQIVSLDFLPQENTAEVEERVTTEKDQALIEKDRTIDEKDRVLGETQEALDEKDRIIEELKRRFS